MRGRERCDVSLDGYLGRAGPPGWKDIVTWRVLRSAAGVVLPLAAGAASGHLEYRVFASLGPLASVAVDQ